MPRCLVALLVLLACTAPAGAETVHSLGQVPSHLKTPEARQFFAEQIEGKPAPDGLGVKLPAALSAKTIIGLLVPPEDHDAVGLVGAKPWHADFYVAIVCTGRAGPADPTEPSCAVPDPTLAPSGHVYLGAIAARPGAVPRLVAAGDALVAIDWSGDTGLPGAPAAAEGAIPPQTIDRFDLAPYAIAPGRWAFGLRVGWTEGYSGGGASFSALDLFATDGTRLKPVLAVPIAASIDIAGDWHPDHTRDHQLSDGANVLVVSRHPTDGYFDLIVKGRTGHWHRRYRWSPAAGAYRPATG